MQLKLALAAGWLLAASPALAHETRMIPGKPRAAFCAFAESF